MVLFCGLLQIVSPLPSVYLQVILENLKDFFLYVFSSILKNTVIFLIQFSSVSVVSDSLRPHESQHTRPPCPSPTPGVHSNSCPSSRWCHPAISSSVIPFSSCPQSLPASDSFPMSQLLAWGGQSIGVSALASVLPMNTQDWSVSFRIDWLDFLISLKITLFFAPILLSTTYSTLTWWFWFSWCVLKLKWWLSLSSVATDGRRRREVQYKPSDSWDGGHAKKTVIGLLVSNWKIPVTRRNTQNLITNNSTQIFMP